MATSGMQVTEAFDRGGRLGLSVVVWKSLALVFAVAAFGSARSSRAQAPVLPPPAYENSLQIGYFCIDDCYSTDQLMQQKADMLRARVGEGPYLRLGLFTYTGVDMPWPLPSDPALAQLTPEVETNLRALLERARRAGIGLHDSAIYGITRDTEVYDPAVAEDRRNAQWLATGAPSWVTPSRYARRLRAHLETKVRAFTKLLATLRAEFPETFVSVAADGEVELSADGYSDSLPYEAQVLADYSPFTIAEFRDWVRNTGLYGPGGPFEGQGRAASGAKYRTGNDAADLAAFNADFGTGFGAWRLRYFDWDLSDPVNGDPNAVGPAETGASNWNPRPSSGPRYLAGGFDAPRTWNEGSAAFWKLWLAFREALIANYVRDVATWMAGTVTPEGWSLSRDRIYTYQIPGDYLYGTYPGCWAPERRYLTSASTFASADTGGIVSLGVTVFDKYEWNGSQNYYEATSQYLFPDIAARRPFNWGLIEANLSMPISAVETDPNIIAARLSRARDAGMHLYGHYPWSGDPTESTTILLDGVGLFAQAAKNQPYDAALRNYAPPPVRGVAATLYADRVGIGWTDTIFAESPGFRWTDWGDFQSFEVLRASAPDAPPSSWQLVGRSTGNKLGLTLSSLSAAKPWYFVRAISKKGLPGEATPVLAPCPLPVIRSLSATPPLIRSGTLAKIEWKLSNALSVSFMGASLPPQDGSQEVFPSQTTIYTLTASNGCGSSEASVTVNVNGGTAGLGAPVISAPGAGQVIGVSAVTFSWGAMGSAQGYDLRLFDTGTGQTVFSGSLSGGGSTSTVIQLPAGVLTFAVRACNGTGYGDGACGAYGTVGFTVNLISPSEAPVVTFPAQGANLTTSTQVLSWTTVTPNPALPDMKYEVVLQDVVGGTTALQTAVPHPSSSTVFSLHSSTQYELKVRACQAGCGPWSAAVTFSVTLPPVPTQAPTITSTSVTSGNLTVSWTAVAGADLYQVQVVQPGAGPGGGALTVAARQVSETTAMFPVPVGSGQVVVTACTGDGCGPESPSVGINPTGSNPALPNLGTPMVGTVVSGPTVLFTWSRVPGDNGANTTYRLYVRDFARQDTALDVQTTSNFYGAQLKAEGTRYDAVVVVNPDGTGAGLTGPAAGFNLGGTSATAPTMVSPRHNSTVTQGNITLGWSPVPGATLYQYYVASGTSAVTGVTPGLFVQVPLTGTGGGTLYNGIVRACPAGATCVAGSETGWGPWSNASGGPGVTSFTVVP